MKKCVLAFGTFSAMSIPLLALVGCSSGITKPVEKNRVDRLELRDGAWLGTFDTKGVAADDSEIKPKNRSIPVTSTFLVTVCDGMGIFWYKKDDGGLRAAARREWFHSHSNHGNHLIFFENHDRETQSSPGWVETQTMQLIELESSALRVQWARAVSNPNLPETDRNRDFFWHGIGTFQQVDSRCPRKMMDAIVND